MTSFRNSRLFAIANAMRKLRPVNAPLRVLARALGGIAPSMSRLGRKVRVSGVVRLKFAGQSFLACARCDDVIVDSLYFDGTWEDEAAARLFSRLARRASVIFDVGANTGLYSILAGLANPVAKVYAFEPHPGNFERLTANLRLNALAQVAPISHAVSSRDESLELHLPSDGSISLVASMNAPFAARHLNSSTVGIRVEAVSLDSFVRKHEIRKVDLMKIDVEYHETSVLAGARALIETNRPTVLCEVQQRDEAAESFGGHSRDSAHPDEIAKFFLSRSYTMYAIDDRHVWSVTSAIPETKNYLFTPSPLLSSDAGAGDGAA